MNRYVTYAYGMPEFAPALISADNSWFARKEYGRLKGVAPHNVVALRDTYLSSKDRVKFADILAPIPRPGELFKEVK